MAVTTFADGSQTATLDTEHFLSSPNAPGVYQLFVDTNAMVAGDVLKIRVYLMTRASGTQRLAFPPQVYTGPQTDDQIKFTVPVATSLSDTNAIRFSIEQTDGTGRAFPWRVDKHA